MRKSPLAIALLAAAAFLPACHSHNNQTIETREYDITQIVAPQTNWSKMDDSNWESFESLGQAKQIQTTVKDMLAAAPADPKNKSTTQPTTQPATPDRPQSADLRLDKTAILIVTGTPDQHDKVEDFLSDLRLNRVQTVTQLRFWLVQLPADSELKTLKEIADIQKDKIAVDRGYYLFSDRQRGDLLGESQNGWDLGTLNLANPGTGLIENTHEKTLGTQLAIKPVEKPATQPAAKPSTQPTAIKPSAANTNKLPPALPNLELAVASYVGTQVVPARDHKHEWTRFGYDHLHLDVKLNIKGYKPLIKKITMLTENNAVIALESETPGVPQYRWYLIVRGVAESPEPDHPRIF